MKYQVAGWTCFVKSAPSRIMTMMMITMMIIVLNLRGAFNKKIPKLGFCPNKGGGVLVGGRCWGGGRGGLTESQVFVETVQNQIDGYADDDDDDDDDI